MDIIEKTISNLVESQFPGFYREEGPIFVEFVKKYYEWMETEYCILNEKQNLGSVSVSFGNNVVVGTGTFFLDKFSNVEVNDTMGNVIQCPRIAIFKEDDSEYIWYNIDTVANNTHIILKSAPQFNGNNLSYGTTKRQKNPLYQSRHFYEYKDIDETTEQFLLFFKEKYLKNIRFETQTNTRQLIKHALDIYRSKGTERSIDLLFRLVFGSGAEVYLPSQDIFRLSDGQWYVPRYLEVSLNNNNVRFVGKQLTGATSGAKAFVDSVIRRNVKGKLVDVLYISAIKGNFVTGEVLYLDNDPVIFDSKIKIIGSLTSIDINQNGIGANYNVGDIIDISSVKGEQGKARVTATSNATGVVTFTLENGGFGYTSNAQVIISEKVLTISNLQTSETNNYFNTFDTLTQPIAYINFENSTSEFSNGESIFTYHPNNAVKGTGLILYANNAGSNAGTLTVYPQSGDLDESIIYTTDNTISASLTLSNGYFSQNVTANIMGSSANLLIFVSDVTNTFSRNDEVFQLNLSNVEIANAKVRTFTSTIGTNGTILVQNVNGVFSPQFQLKNRNSNATCNVDSQTLSIGVYDIDNDFVSFEGNFVYTTNNQTNGTVTFVSTGAGANLGISNDFLYSEVVRLNTDKLIDYANVALNSSNYGFPPSGNETLSTIMDDALSYDLITIGKIRSLIGVNRGDEYNIAPLVTIYDPNIYYFDRQDYKITLSNSTNFAIGELITQEATGARGLIKSTSNSTVLFVERLNLLRANNFVATTNSSTVIVGSSSGFSANVFDVTTDFDSRYLGFNSDISSESITSNGVITSVEIIDSGFGYVDNEEIIFAKGNEVAVATSRLGTGGKGTGYYKKNGGFLSDVKKLYDGLYYQEYSYDILSSMQLNKYEQMLKQILHVAGTKYFSTLDYKSFIPSTINIGNDGYGSIIEIGGPEILLTDGMFDRNFNEKPLTTEDQEFILR
jgi:hypothetical protein